MAAVVVTRFTLDGRLLYMALHDPPPHIDRQHASVEFWCSRGVHTTWSRR